MTYTTHIPTRDELNELVDLEFFAQHPDAPAILSGSGEADARWRRIWRETFDRVLHRETDRVFHDMFPAAPHRLTPEDPEYSGYVLHWINIREQINTRAPKPGSDDDGALVEGVDYSYLRADLYAGLDHVLIRDYPAVVAAVRVLVEQALEAIPVEVDEGWDADNGSALLPVQERLELDSRTILVTVLAWWSDRSLRGRLEIEPVW